MKEMKDIISSYESKHAEKRRKYNESLVNYFKEKEDKKETNSILETVDKKIALENLTEDVKMSYDVHRKEAISENLNSNLVETIFFESIKYIIYESLVLDDDFKVHNKDYITETCDSFLTEINDNGLVSIPHNSLIESIYNSINSIINSNENAKINDVITQIKENCSFEFELAINAIREKVKNVVLEEKAIKLATEKLKESGRELNEEKTLFKKLFEKNIECVVEESEGKMKNKEVMDISMCESIFDYTLLETVNTLRLISLDMSKLKTVVKYI